MLYFQIGADGKVAQVLSDSDDRQARNGALYRGDIKDFDHAIRLAAESNELAGDKLYLPVDKGNSTWPRYDVIKAPRVGEAVSKAFNGDSYPDGYITKVGGTDCSRVYTDTGNVYNRRRKTGTWVQRSGTFMLTHGHVDKRNPSF